MFKKKIIIDIRVNYCTKFGEEIAMVGDLEELGQWNPLKAMPLHWNENDFWTTSLKLNIEPRMSFQFKFIVINRSLGKVIQWEFGINRCFSVSKLYKPRYFYDYIWNHRNCVITLRHEFQNYLIPFIIGSTNSLGSMKIPMRMEMKLKSRYNFPNTKSNWKMNFLITMNEKVMKYAFGVYNTFENKIHLERFFERKIVLDPIPLKSLSNDAIVQLKGDQIKLHHNSIHTKFLKVKLSESIWFGSIPENENEVRQLRDVGITKFINLSDFTSDCNNLQWKFAFTKGLIYERRAFNGKTINLCESNEGKISEAAKELQRLVLSNETVYIHSCVSRELIIDCLLAYLILYKRSSYEVAHKLLSNAVSQGVKGFKMGA